jgi:hypothetical protein
VNRVVVTGIYRAIFCEAIVVTSLLSTEVLHARTWTDKTGKHKIEAELVEVTDGVAELRKADGTTVKMPLAKLSKADQDFLKQSSDKSKTDDAASSPNDSGFKVETMSLSIAKELPKDPAAKQNEPQMTMSMPIASGTRFGLLISHPSQQLVDLDSSKTKIAECKDDAGGNLSKQEKKQSSFLMMSQPFQFNLRPDGHSALIELALPNVPKAGANKIHLRANLAVQCGTGEKTVEQANVTLAAGQKITVGPVPFQIDNTQPQNFGDTKFVVNLSTNKPTAVIKKLIFLGADGKEIPQQEMGSGTMGFGDQMTFSRTIGLAAAVDKATIRVVHYEKLETINVLIGLGF